MQVTITGTPGEIAAVVLELQEWHQRDRIARDTMRALEGKKAQAFPETSIGPIERKDGGLNDH